MQETLLEWKERLEKERDDIINKQIIIEERLSKKKMMWEITQEIDVVKQGPITKSTKAALERNQQELEVYKKENATKLDEIAAILEVVEEKINREN
ncbi:hypothetical protein [Halalkalibacter akibai]|uniref:Uncharacterized protein n=1 Tax=Halalkalibacter akibai (strain ATCC 43226 / DSM 21942 / CIP 109018 / JCM 9157 / 1139) TaxID=1236973 RepID=W4QV29_HALA3|nr:hypothetical protein [Halalkalibacter akibai]GAE35787.1 hypothetical protein JCM9157_2924 [Halalkalibacter akibai JCM 9157]